MKFAKFVYLNSLTSVLRPESNSTQARMKSFDRSLLAPATFRFTTHSDASGTSAATHKL